MKIGDNAKDKTQASVTVEVVAHKDKLQKETVTLVDANDAAKRVSLVIQARVLGTMQIL